VLILIDLPKTDRLESCLCHRDLYRSTNAQHSLYSINLIQLKKKRDFFNGWSCYQRSIWSHPKS